MKLFKKMKKGFTLVELVVVIAVIAILAATSVGVYFGMVDSANRSADQAAVVQMNKVLVLENTLGNVDSILDVHEVFEKNGLTAKNYTALKTGYKFYYDVEDNKILYVNSNNVVEYPEEEVGKDHSAHNWYSLNLSIEKESVSKNSEGAYVVSKAEQVAYVFDKIKNGTAGTESKLILTSDIDMKGASIAVSTLPAGSSLTIESSDGTPKTIKNLVSNETHLKSLSSFGIETNYYSSILFGQVEGSLTIKNIKFENAHVKATDGSSLALIAGQVSKGSVTIKDVEFKNCSVTGGRNVALIAGNIYQTKDTSISITHVTVTNSEVNVAHGRSGLLIGMMEYSSTIAAFNLSNISIANSSMKKVGSHSTVSERPAGFNDYYTYPTNEANNQVYVSFVKDSKTSTYAFLESALVTYRYGTTSGSGALAAITDVSSPINGLVKA